jgi:hypothetical protein
MGEKFTDVWVLLSDTDRFVSRARLMFRYEKQLRQWRSRLTESSRDMDVAREVRDQIVAFRRDRRLEGWELRLGSLDIQVKGFRSDDAMSAGFRRMVAMVNESGEVRYAVGSGNHVQLDKELTVALRHAPPKVPLESHYLWYRRNGGVLELAGADSQPRDSHEKLKVYVEEHKSALVRAFYKLV